MTDTASDVFRAEMAGEDSGAFDNAPVVESQATEQAAQPDLGAPAQPEPQAQTSQQESHRVPLRELLDEREQRQALQRRLEEFERREAAAKAEVEKKPRPDVFEDPSGFVQDHLNPVQQQIQQMQQQYHQMLMHNARMAAMGVLGADKVSAAEKAFNEALKAGELTPEEASRINSQPNPFEAAVKWHQRQSILKEVGEDPAAYRQRVIDEWLSDPANAGRALAAQRQAARPVIEQAQPAGRVTALPSANRASAATGLDDEPEDPVEAFRQAQRGR